MLHISPYLKKNYKIYPYFRQIYKFRHYFRKISVFASPNFDHVAFKHHALHVLDAPCHATPSPSPYGSRPVFRRDAPYTFRRGSANASRNRQQVGLSLGEHINGVHYDAASDGLQSSVEKAEPKINSLLLILLLSAVEVMSPSSSTVPSPVGRKLKAYKALRVGYAVECSSN